MKKSKRNIDYNATFQVKIVSNWKGEKLSSNKKENEAKKGENFDEIPKNLMDKDELNEKHFQNAIKHKITIPVPEIVTIDKEDYDRLYPDNYSIPKIRIMMQPKEEEIDYDADSGDDEWLKENGQALKLTYDDFEKYMDYLEKKSSETKKVPSLYDLTTHFKKTNLLSMGIEATYDYWLNKRLNANGNALLYNLKKDVGKPGVRCKYDPYVAFRPCRERMYLRKNRARDYENYFKMLAIRKRIDEQVKFFRTNALCETTKHELLKLRFATFQDQFRSGGFNSCYLEKEVQCNTEFLLRDLKENRIGYNMHKNETETKLNENVDEVHMDTEDCDDEMFPFKRVPNCAYFEIKNDCFEPDFIPEYDDKDIFYSTDDGITRRRLGRGGRIIYDRIKIPEPTGLVSEFQQIDVCKNVLVKRYNGMDEIYTSSSPRSSPFNLDSASPVNGPLDLTDVEIICTFDK